MTNIGNPTVSPEVPSTRRLVLATAVALAIAAIVLVTVVLPAEYGLDPLGTGRAFGLSALTEPLAEVAPLPVAREGLNLTPVQTGQMALYPGAFKVDSRELVLGPYEYLELKYHLEQGSAMVFSWRADGDVAQEFHGDADGLPPWSEPTQSYDKQPRQNADGSFVAPFSGLHGWFWENLGGRTISITLTTAGFYTTAHEFRFDHTRRQLELGGPDRIATSPAPTEAVP